MNFSQEKKAVIYQTVFLNDFPKQKKHITSDWNRFTAANRRALDRRLVKQRLWVIKLRAMKLDFQCSTPHSSWVKRFFSRSSLSNGCFSHLQLGGFNVFVFHLPKMVGKWTSQFDDCEYFCEGHVSFL